MSPSTNRVVEPDLGTSSVDKSERMLAGFPWVSAIVLYTLSWGWSLLRPNTLYWDDTGPFISINLLGTLEISIFNRGVLYGKA